MDFAQTLGNEALVVFGKVQMLENEALVAHSTGRSVGGCVKGPIAGWGGGLAEGSA